MRLSAGPMMLSIFRLGCRTRASAGRSIPHQPSLSSSLAPRSSRRSPPAPRAALKNLKYSLATHPSTLARVNKCHCFAETPRLRAALRRPRVATNINHQFRSARTAKPHVSAPYVPARDPSNGRRWTGSLRVRLN